MLHLATLTRGMKEFVVMLCRLGECKGKLYIEEVVLTTVDWTNDVFANLKFIDDDNEAEDLFRFVEERKIVDMKHIADVLIDSGRNHLM